MIGLVLAAVFYLERATSPCDTFAELAVIQEFRPEDPDRYVDSYEDWGVLPLTGYCYQVTDACAVDWARQSDDHISVWWTRTMPELERVRFSSKTRLEWDLYDRGERGEVPDTIAYQVLSGNLGNYALTQPIAVRPWSEPYMTVAAGDGGSFWFLVRGVNACGVGP